MNKYVKPGSLTWWASVVPILAGLFVAAEPLHGLTMGIEVINNATDNMSPFVLINAGLAGIGLRGAIE